MDSVRGLPANAIDGCGGSKLAAGSRSDREGGGRARSGPSALPPQDIDGFGSAKLVEPVGAAGSAACETALATVSARTRSASFRAGRSRRSAACRPGSPRVSPTGTRGCHVVADRERLPRDEATVEEDAHRLRLLHEQHARRTCRRGSRRRSASPLRSTSPFSNRPEVIVESRSGRSSAPQPEPEPVGADLARLGDLRSPRRVMWSGHDREADRRRGSVRTQLSVGPHDRAACCGSGPGTAAPGRSYTAADAAVPEQRSPRRRSSRPGRRRRRRPVRSPPRRPSGGRGRPAAPVARATASATSRLAETEPATSAAKRIAGRAGERPPRHEREERCCCDDAEREDEPHRPGRGRSRRCESGISENACGSASGTTSLRSGSRTTATATTAAATAARTQPARARRGRASSAKAEEEQRRGGDQVPLGEQPELARGERRRPRARARPPTEQATARKARARGVVLPAPQRPPEQDEQRACGEDAREQREVAGVVADEPRGRTGRVRAARVARTRRARCRPRRAATRARRRRAIAIAAERQQRSAAAAAARAAEQRVERERGHEHGNEHDRLQPRREREAERRHEQRLPRAASARRARRHRPRREHEHRVEDDLGHHEPGVREPGQRERQRGRDERPAARHQRPCPRGTPASRRATSRAPAAPSAASARAPGRRCESGSPASAGHDGAVVRRRPAQDREVPVAVEALSEQAVDHLVGRDPRRRHAAARPRPQRRRAAGRARREEPSRARGGGGLSTASRARACQRDRRGEPREAARISAGRAGTMPQCPWPPSSRTR